ncbi:MAG: hypothetical protein QM487_03525 [Candidatus Marithrix sp.]
MKKLVLLGIIICNLLFSSVVFADMGRVSIFGVQLVEQIHGNF